MDLFWLSVSWVAFFTVIALVVVKLIFKKGLLKPIHLPVRLVMTPFLLVFLAYVFTQWINMMIDWDDMGTLSHDINVPKVIAIFFGILLLEQVFLATKKFRFWKIWAFEIVLLLIIPVYTSYCDLYWERDFGNHYHWEWDEGSGNQFFEPVAPEGEITKANLANHDWYRATMEPDHGMYLGEVTLSFQDDTLMKAHVEYHLIDDIWWTYPVFGNWVKPEGEFDKEYRLYLDEMFFIADANREWDLESDSVKIELIGERLSIDYLF
jgi:hypothetical protein